MNVRCGSRQQSVELCCVVPDPLHCLLVAAGGDVLTVDLHQAVPRPQPGRRRRRSRLCRPVRPPDLTISTDRWGLGGGAPAYSRDELARSAALFGQTKPVAGEGGAEVEPAEPRPLPACLLLVLLPHPATLLSAQ